MEYYNDILLPRGIHGVLGILLWRQDNARPILNVTHSPREVDFMPQDADALRPFLPHFRRAVDMTSRLPLAAVAGSGLELLADGLGEGVLLLDVTERLVYANPAAEAVLRRQDGLSLTARVLRACDPAAPHRLVALLRRALGVGASGGGMVADRRGSGPAMRSG